MIKCFLIVLVLTCNSLCFGQQLPLKDDQRARQQAEFLIDQMPSQIKLMDDPTLRIFLRLRLAKFFWENNPKIPEPGTRAELLVVEALEDLETHEKEMPPLYAKGFHRELLALLKTHAPIVAVRVTEQDENKNIPNQFQVVFTMLESDAGAKPALEILRRSLSAGEDPGFMLSSILFRLDEKRSSDLPQLLTDIVSIEEQKPGAIPMRAIIGALRFYLEEETPSELRARYFAVVVNSIEQNQSRADQSKNGYKEQEELHFAYFVMNNITPKIQGLSPSLYPRARNLLSALATRIPQSLLDRMVMRARIDQSSDPLNQLIIEAAATKDQAVKDGLLIEAAQLASSKGLLKKAVEILPETTSEYNYELWRDQFLGDIVKRALKEKELELADHAASRIASDLNRAVALRNIALYYFDSKDIARAKDLLNEAAKLIRSAENKSHKAVELLFLAVAFNKIDELRAPEMVQEAIKATNDIPLPSPEDKPDSDSRKDYAKSLTGIAWNVIPVFERLVKKDVVGAFGLASGFQRQELKYIAMFGAATGILKEAKSAESKATK